MTKLHENIWSGCWGNAQKPFKKCIRIGHLCVRFSRRRRAAMKKWTTAVWKEIYRRFRISNQILRSINGSRDIDRSLDTTLLVFGQNWHFVDEYLENGEKFEHAVFAGCSILISSTFWSILAKIVRAVFQKKSKNPYFDHVIVLYGWTGIFSDKPPCTFLPLIILNFHAKNQKNP